MNRIKIADLEHFINTSHGYDSDYVYDLERVGGDEAIRALLRLARAARAYGDVYAGRDEYEALWEALDAFDWDDSAG